MINSYRLIWFQHLSKAAGSSIIRLADINGEKFYPQHSNAIPRTEDGRLIRLWEMDAEELSTFVDHCQHHKITFVATEWAAPIFSVLSDDPRVKLISCIRDPLERFVSNYYYAYYSGRTDCKTLSEYIDSEESIWGTFTRTNYYCRIFSRHHEKPEAITQALFELACSNLALFDCCEILHEKADSSQLNQTLGWEVKEVHVNRSSLDFLSLSKLIVKGKVKSIWRHIFSPKKPLAEDFVIQFKEKNVWDYKLMQATDND